LDGLGEPDDPDPINRLSAKVQAIVAFYPPTDLASIDTPVRDRINALLFGPESTGVPSPARDSIYIYHDASPIAHVSTDDSPTLLVHGDADASVPLEQSTRLRAALQRAGVENELIVVRGGGHGPGSLAAAPNPPDY
jgi:dipeptidyl aminopeptidase/acylaminoacyl peptidase